MTILKAGHVFHGPDGQGYTLTRDVENGDTILDTDFKPFGGAPEPVEFEELVDWLERQVFELAPPPDATA